MKASLAAALTAAAATALAARVAAAEAPRAAPPDPQVAALGLPEDTQPARDYPGWRRPERILVGPEVRARLPALREEFPGIEFVLVASEAEAVREAPLADAAIDLCAPQILAAGATGRLRWVQLMSAGVNRCLPLPEVQSGKIRVTAMQGVGSAALADHAMALVLALTRGLNLYLRDAQRGRWSPGLLDPQRHYELAGRTLLVVGLGGIGTEVARRAQSFGMRVIATRASGREHPAFVSHVGLPGELPALASEADVIVSCVPLTPATRGIFDARFFARMKPTAYFVNIGRGASVVTADLVRALETQRIAGAGLDVTDPEPLPADHPLWRLPNVVITPHVAWYSAALEEQRWRIARENLRRYAAGAPLLQPVDAARGY